MAGEPTSSPFHPVSLKVSNSGDSNASQRQSPLSLLRQPSAPASTLVHSHPPRQSATETELESLHIQLKKANYDLSNLRAESERTKLRYENMIRDRDTQILVEQKKSQDLQKDRKFLFDKQQSQSTELLTLQDEYANYKLEAEAALRTLRKENAAMQDQMVELEERLTEVESSSQRQVEQASQKTILAQEALKKCKEDLRRTIQDLGYKRSALNRSQEMNSEYEAELRELRTLKENSEQSEILKRDLSEATNYVSQLEATSRKQVAELEQLRPLAQNAAINVEKIHNLETQISLMGDMRKRLTEKEIEITFLKKEKSAWETFLESNEGNQRPEEISRELHQERAAHKADQERIETQETELNELRARIRTMEQTVENLNSEVQAKQEQLTKAERRYERLDRQKNLAQREVQFVKEQLKAYDSEETVFFGGAGVDSQKQARIEGLEKLLEQYKQEINRVSKEGLLPSSSSDSNKRKRKESSEEDEESRRRIRMLQNDLTKSRQSEELLQKDVTALKSQLESLEKVVKLSTTRVLELKNNPASRHQAIQKKYLDQLADENAALLQRLQGKGIGVPKETVERMKGEIERMEDLVAQKEKRMMRLKEVITAINGAEKQIWTAKSQEFREAVFSLLGYRLDFLQNGRVRCTSMFSSSTDQAFIFDGEEGTMQLVSQEAAEKNREWFEGVKNLVDFWVNERETIPCFLAALTLELFDRSTSLTNGQA